MSTVEPHMVDCQYAYRRQGSAEALLADLDSFVQESFQINQVAYLVGLDIEGALDSADPISFMEALDHMQVPQVLSRFIGDWMAIRKFRLRLTAPTGEYWSSLYTQSGGVPQGGGLPSLMWLFLVNRLPERVKGHLRAIAPNLDLDNDILIQIFADDISVALRGQTVSDLINLGAKLGRILH